MLAPNIRAEDPQAEGAIIKSGMLDRLPSLPAGMKYAYDPKTGKVDYVSK